MIILLDSAAFLSDPHCEGVAWGVLVHACQSWGLRVVTTDVVLAEVVAGYQRKLRESQQGLSKLSRILGPLGLKEILSAPLKALNESEASYSDLLRRRLADRSVEVIQVPAIPHMEIVNRAVMRRRPCDEKGDGYRDTLNWLTFLGVVKENPDEHLVLVTDDSDFASQDGESLHPDLLEDLSAINASSRVSWSRGLKDLVLKFAAERSIEVGDDLRSFADQLRNITVLEYLSSNTVASAVGSALDPYTCGLPLETESASLLGVANARNLNLELTGQISGDLAVGAFELEADAEIDLTVTNTSEDDESLPGSPDGGGRSPQLTKVLLFRGIITLGVHGKPQTAELSSIEALPDDPGRTQWEGARNAVLQLNDWAKVIAGLPALQLPPDYFKTLAGIKLPPDYFKGLAAFRLPPDYFKGLAGIKLPPDYFKGLAGIKFPRDYTTGPEPTSPDSESNDQNEPPDTAETGNNGEEPDGS